MNLCDREPIHVPGAIQPHGAFVAALAGDLRVTHVSANLAMILGSAAEQALGRALRDVIGTPAFTALCSGVGAGGSALNDSAASDRVHFLSGPDGATLYLRAFQSGPHICIDIEPTHFEPRQRLPIVQAQAVLGTFRHASSAEHLCELAVHGLKAITGYHRVMAYRFDDDGDGEVVAEARDEVLEPYLGQRYPASDIPAQARTLYLRQRVGAIASANYTPVQLLQPAGTPDRPPLDLTHSALRSVSAVHCEYMRNMGTAASLTVGLAHGDSLWGMLVCHHIVPRVPGPELRAAADTIGQVVSLLLGSLDAADVYAQRLQRNATLHDLVTAMAKPVPLLDAVAGNEADLLQLVRATGAVVRIGGEVRHFGRTPADPQAAFALLQDAAGGDALAVADVALRYPSLSRCTADGSGALLVPLASGADDAVLWFRPELARVVTWGGNPTEHGAADTATARISPRASFAAWKQTVLGRSAPWTAADIAMGREFAQAVADEVGARTRAALRESERTLGLLAEHSGDVITLNDLQGIRRYVSPASMRLLGWRPDELVGTTTSAFVHAEDIDAFRASRSQLTNSELGESTAYFRHRCKDGSWRWVEGRARMRPGDNGGPTLDYVVVLRDATERKAAELKLMDALERVQQLAATDALTGLANRGHFDHVSVREWRRCARERQPLSLLMVDADQFKKYNDHYGHLAGDRCLCIIASQLAVAARRPGDTAARYGGEEFVLLLPGTESAGAMIVAERLISAIHALGMAHEDNAPSHVVTVSVGCATALPGSPDSAFASLEALLTAADAALYRAKDGGRNRMAIARS